MNWVVTETGRKFHRPECEWAEGRPTTPYVEGMTAGDPRTQQQVPVVPCGICRPTDAAFTYNRRRRGAR
jgi:hypothetical protein